MKTHKKWSIISFLMLAFLFLPNITMFTESPDFYQVNAETHETNTADILKAQLVDPQSSARWNHQVMKIDQAWADGFTGEGVNIAILDTGFDIQHADLSMVGGNSVFPDDPWSNDHSGHGTHVAGIIGANIGSTYQGIAPDANLYGIKIYHEEDIDESGYVSTNIQSVISGIQIAMDVDADIIVISSGLTYDDNALHQKIIQAHKRGILIVAASGNGSASVNYPASYPEVIAITAVDERLHPALDIIYGQENEFAAPGVNIGGLSIPNSPYSYPYIIMSGSSQAVPHAAGLAAILMEKHGSRGEDIRKLMRETALDLGDPGFYGYGLLRYTSENNNATASPVQDTPPAQEEEEEPTTEVTEENEGVNIEDQAAQKPISSRAPDNEEEEAEELSAHYYTDAFQQGDYGAISNEVLQLVEAAGTLEIRLQSLNAVYLNETQINNIRERNITIVLARENASWSIPPANLLPGVALLRFYEGVPIGFQAHEAAVPPIFTTSIYQQGTNRSVYPGRMRIKINKDNSENSDLNAYGAYCWDKENKEWFEPVTEINDSSVIITTRHTTTLGLLDPNKFPEDVEDASDSTIESDTNSITPLQKQLLIGVLLLVVILVAVRFLLRKQK